MSGATTQQYRGKISLRLYCSLLNRPVVETVLGHPQPPPDQSVSTNLVLDPNLFIDFDGVQEYLEHLNTLSDLIRGAHIQVDMEFNRIQNTLKEIWEENTDLRKRGLRGGRARKQNKLGKSFASMQNMTPEQTKRRKEVEAKDYQGRNRLEGLKQILTLLETSHQFVQEQQTMAEEVLLAGRKVALGSANRIEACIAHAADTVLFDANHEELGDIEDMLKAFYDEYGL